MSTVRKQNGLRDYSEARLNYGKHQLPTQDISARSRPAFAPFPDAGARQAGMILNSGAFFSSQHATVRTATELYVKPAIKLSTKRKETILC